MTTATTTRQQAPTPSSRAAAPPEAQGAPGPTARSAPGSTARSAPGSTARSAPGSTARSAPGSTTAPSSIAGALFVVATHKVRDRAAAAPNAWLPYGTEHAWRPGTRRTLCGEWIYEWTVFWDRRFSARPAAACPRCVEATLPEESRRRLDRLAG